jgi:cell division protein ZapE
MTDGPLFAYRAHCRAGRLKSDPVQALAAEKLQSLYRAVGDYRPSSGPAGWRERLGLARRQRAAAPQGLYLFGPVGRGKSMLMDMFYDSVPVAAKRRVHFHEFMIEIHASLHEIRRRGGVEDPLGIVAGDIAARSWLLCFDEFQVENIADAMILGRLFQGLFKAGAVVVATSNTAPADLYKGKLQYDRFVPFIDLLRARLDVLELAGAVDYRRESLRAMQLYHTPLDSEAEAALDSAFTRLTAGAPADSEALLVQGRTLDVPTTASGVARFSFADLCEQPLGAADYLAIAKRFHTIILSGIPQLPPARRNESKRFLTLIDALYEHKVNLVCSAAVAADEIYPEGDGAAAFERAVSRLLEMQTDAYIGLGHLVSAETDQVMETPVSAG